MRTDASKGQYDYAPPRGANDDDIDDSSSLATDLLEAGPLCIMHGEAALFSSELNVASSSG